MGRRSRMCEQWYYTKRQEVCLHWLHTWMTVCVTLNLHDNSFTQSPLSLYPSHSADARSRLTFIFLVRIDIMPRKCKCLCEPLLWTRKRYFVCIYILRAGNCRVRGSQECVARVILMLITYNRVPRVWIARQHGNCVIWLKKENHLPWRAFGPSGHFQAPDWHDWTLAGKLKISIQFNFGDEMINRICINPTPYPASRFLFFGPKTVAKSPNLCSI